MVIENSQIRQGHDGCRVQTRIQSSPTGKLRKLGRMRVVERLMSSVALIKSKTTPTTILQVEKG